MIKSISKLLLLCMFLWPAALVAQPEPVAPDPSVESDEKELPPLSEGGEEGPKTETPGPATGADSPGPSGPAPTAPAPAPPTPAAPAKPATGDATPSGSPFTDTMIRLLQGFRFGSYGRIGVSGDLGEGSKAKSLNIAAHGPRLEETPYAEIDLGYVLDRGDLLSFRVAFTLAFAEDFFHYNGEWDAAMTIRNLYLEATNVFTPALTLWAGSRMYRGDDIYLLDFWPLDSLNTLGAGAMLRFGRTFIHLHGGANRLKDQYQYQKFAVPSPTFGSEEVEVLDRQRAIFSLKATHELHDLTDWLSLKLSLYGEVHYLPDGELREELITKDLPSDNGWVAGFQVGLWGFGEQSHVNLFGRMAGGLAAYGELASPGALSLDRTAADAREYLVALSANYERGRFGMMAGAYMRYFADADGNENDPDDGWEYVVAARPILFLHRFFQQAMEVSWQGKRPNGLNPRTQTHLVPNIFKFSLIPTLSWDRGSYTRPHLRFIYTLSYLDEGARLSYAKEDPRYGESLHHFLGVQVEWWFNSSYR